MGSGHRVTHEIEILTQGLGILTLSLSNCGYEQQNTKCCMLHQEFIQYECAADCLRHPIRMTGIELNHMGVAHSYCNKLVTWNVLLHVWCDYCPW